MELGDEALVVRLSCKPTYEGLKLRAALRCGRAGCRCKPTYEGLKLWGWPAERENWSALQAYL